MKAKRVIPIAAGGMLGTSVIVVSVAELLRLKKMVAAQDKRIQTDKYVIDAQKEDLAGKDLVIASLEEVIEKNREVIGEQEKYIILLEGIHESSIVSESEKDPKERVGQDYIFQYDVDFNVVGQYGSILEACKKVGIKKSDYISRVLSGKRCSTAGYFWSKGQHPFKIIPDNWKKAAEKMKNENK